MLSLQWDGTNCRWHRSSYPLVYSVWSLRWQCQTGDQQWYFLLLSSSSKRTEQQALVTWTASELESYIVQRVSIAASSSLPYLQVETNLSYTPTWKFTRVVHCPDFSSHSLQKQINGNFNRYRNTSSKHTVWVEVQNYNINHPQQSLPTNKYSVPCKEKEGK